jgi:Flp pilus assembly pilin Flp
MTRFLGRLLVNEEGATMLEYAIMLSLIAAALVASITAMSTALGTKFTSVTSTLNSSS